AAVRFSDNVLLVRSMTKEHALPGLRIGYAIGSSERIAALAELRPSWMVSAPAEAAIVAACTEADHVARAREFLLQAKRELERSLHGMGLATVPSETHYLLVRVGDGDRLREHLLARQRISIRSGRSFGLPAHVRIAACAEPQRARLIGALREALR
ncbi:MAG TPA: aminotransferase class I/II-fold pyridoxal phosphate-dependent enzyme, partial [Polyangiales bacterium]